MQRNNRNNIHQLALIGGGTFVAFVFTGAVSWKFQFAVAGLIYFLPALYLRSRADQPHPLLMHIIMLFLLIGFYTLIAIWYHNTHVYPVPVAAIIGYVSGNIAGQALRLKRYPKMALAASPVLLLLFAGSFLMQNWMNYAFNKNNFLSIPAPNFELIAADSTQILYSDSLRNKVTILDFWTTACAVCFEKFPELEKLYTDYKENPSVQIFSVNLPIPQDNSARLQGTIQNYIAPYYTFPVLLAQDGLSTDELGFQGVPTLLIIDKNATIRFAGSLNYNIQDWVYNTGKMIDRLLAEQ